MDDKTKRNLYDTRNNFVWDFLAVLIPVLAILISTTFIVTPSTIEQQQGQVDWIKERQWPFKESSSAPEEGSRNLWNIVEVSKTFKIRY